MTNQIKEVKGIDAENFDWLLAQSDYKINSVFRSANKSVNIYPDSPMVTAHNTINNTTYSLASGTDKSASGTFNFIINSTDNALIDLKDYCFDINAFCYCSITDNSVTNDLKPSSIRDLHFANQPLFPLFAHAEIYIDNVQLERSDNLALSAGIRYTMEYDHSNKAEDAAQINGWQYTDYVERQPVFKIPAADMNATTFSEAYTVSTLDEDTQLCKFKPNKTISGIINGNGTNTLIYVNINQKIKLSDMFSCVNSLPPIFGHQIKISLSRASSSWIGCDTRCRTKMQLDCFETFKLNGVQYIITDELKTAAQKYYSKKIETIFTSRIENLQVIPTKPSSTNEVSYVLTVPLAYKNKCLCIAIPKCNNVFGALQPYTFTDKIYDGDTPNKTNGLYYSEFGKTFNEYVGPALSQLIVSTANGLELIRYEFDRDGTMKGIPMSQSDFMTGFDLNRTPTNTLRYSYLQAYEEMKRCREHFNQLPESCISYLSFLKSYMVYCVDLSPFSISAGENIRITLKCGEWAANYNPFYLYNKETTITNITVNSIYSASSILINLYSDQILRLLPNGKSEIVQLFSEPEPVNVNETA